MHAKEALALEAERAKEAAQTCEGRIGSGVVVGEGGAAVSWACDRSVEIASSDSRSKQARPKCMCCPFAFEATKNSLLAWRMSTSTYWKPCKSVNRPTVVALLWACREDLNL